LAEIFKIFEGYDIIRSDALLIKFVTSKTIFTENDKRKVLD